MNNAPNEAHQEAIEMVLDIISVMKASGKFDNPTLEEIEQRIV
jgi:hypothetical protein